MKNFRKILLALAIFACSAISFTACETYQNSNYCGGIVKSYECIGETEIKIPFKEDDYYSAIQIEISFKGKSNKFYPYIIVVNSFFDDYGCTSIEELFINTDFIESYSNAMTLKANNGKALLELNKEFAPDASIYFYEGIDEYKDLIMIEDLTSYIGYFNLK